MIVFKIVKRPEPGVTGGGVIKYFPSVKVDNEVNTDELVKRIEKYSSLSEPDIRGVITALKNEIIQDLKKGRVIRLESLGAFYPRIHGTGSNSPEDVSQQNINRISIKYVPAKEVLKELKTAKYRKA